MVATVKNRFHTLDAMRGVAAFVVAAFHFNHRGGSDGFMAYLAVDLFFGLSGFVIASNYDARLTSGLSLRRFVEARFIRLYPLYFAGWALGMAKQAAGHLTRDPRALSGAPLAAAAGFNLVVLPTPFHRELFPINGPAWSLFFEAGASIAYGFILVRLPRMGLATIAAASAIALALLAAPPGFANLGWSWATVPGGLARTAFSFCTGMLIARSLGAEAPCPSAVGVLLVAAAAAILLAGVPTSTRRVYELAAIFAGFPILLAAATRFDPPARLRRAAAVLGDLSYPAYAVHWPLIAAAGPLAGRLAPHPGGLRAALWAYLGFVAVTAWAIGRFYDAPLRAWLSARLGLRRSAPPAAITSAA